MWDAVQSFGPAVCHPHGHGLGLEVRDYPILVDDNGLRVRDVRQLGAAGLAGDDGDRAHGARIPAEPRRSPGA